MRVNDCFGGLVERRSGIAVSYCWTGGSIQIDVYNLGKKINNDSKKL